jgi:nucleoside-diphosphate-sugar epimerase
LDAANLAVKISGRGTIEVHDRDTDFPSRGALNIDAARQDFGYFPQVDVEEGFQAYYEWLNNSEYWKSQCRA